MPPVVDLFRTSWEPFRIQSPGKPGDRSGASLPIFHGSAPIPRKKREEKDPIANTKSTFHLLPPFILRKFNALLKQA
jgi:hypothetical protein